MSETTQPRKRGRPKVMSDEERRATIIATAEKLFTQNGYGGTSTDEIASLCKISKQTLYRIFPGKLELFAAVAESHRSKMIDLKEDYDDLPLKEALRKIFMIDIDQRAFKVRAAFLRAVFMESLHYPKLQNIMKHRSGVKTRNDLKAWLDRQCRKKGLVIQNTESAARMFMDAFTGAIIFEAIGGFSWDSREERVAHFCQCIDIVLHGIMPTADACPAPA